MSNRRNGNSVHSNSNSVPPPHAGGSNPEDNVFPTGWFSLWISVSLALPFLVAPLMGFLVPHDPDIESLWWRRALMYRTDAKTFWDSDGDGVGDLKGIRAKLDELQSSGVGGIWLSNLYGDRQGMETMDPALGDMARFDALVSDIHKRDMHIIVDFIPNHTSDKHARFHASKKSDNQFRDYYVWHDGSMTARGERQPPNNWKSQEGGSAWTYEPQRDQYYMHQRSKYHPDLNYTNPAVREYAEGILKFWLKHHVDGFVTLDAHKLVEAELSLDEPPSFKDVDKEDHSFLNHVYTQHQPETLHIIDSWAEIVSSFNEEILDRYKLLAADIQDSPLHTDWVHWSQYYETTGLEMPLNYQTMKLLRPDCDCLCVAGQIKTANLSVPEFSSMNWVLHTPVRGISPSRHRLLSMLQMLLPGTPILYDTQDTVGAPGKHDHMDATLGSSHERSMLNSLAKLRRAQAFIRGNIHYGVTNRDVLTFVRIAQGALLPRYMVLLNFGKQPVQENFAVKIGKLQIPEMATVVFNTQSKDGSFDVNYSVNMTDLVLKPGHGMVVQIN